MRKRMFVLWSLLLCVCGLVLAACGGSGGGGGIAAADPSEKFIGTWQLAAVETRGITVVGDFTAILGTDESVAMVIEKDGKGNVTFNGESADMTWELSDDNTLVAKGTNVNEETGEGLFNADEVSFAYTDGALVAEWTSDEESFKGTFTESGSLPNEPEINLSTATDVTSIDQIAGDWTLGSMSFMGATMYGSPEALAEVFGDESYTSLSVSEDGSMKLMGQDVTCTIGDDGAVVDLIIYKFPIKMIGDDLVVDMSSAMGSDVALCYSK